MRKISLGFCLTLVFFLFFACVPVKNKEYESPFGEENNATITAEFGQSVLSEDFYFSGNPVKIEYQLMNSDIPCEVGVVIFCDGIIQEYYIDDFQEYKYMHYISLSPNENKAFNLNFTPDIGKKGEVLSLYIATVNNPSYLATLEYEAFGNNHAMGFHAPFDLVMKEDSKKKQYVVSSSHCNYDLKEKDETYSENSDSYTNIEFYEGTDNINKIIYSEGVPLIVTLEGTGTCDATYRTTFFVNHTPIKLKDGSDYIDMEIQQGKISSIKIELLPNVVSNINHIYSISIPICSNDQNNAFPIKTRSRLLYME